MRPALGADSEGLDRLLARGLVDHGPRFRAARAAARAFVRQVRDGKSLIVMPLTDSDSLIVIH